MGSSDYSNEATESLEKATSEDVAAGEAAPAAAPAKGETSTSKEDSNGGK
jgi:hypothetical protein